MATTPKDPPSPRYSQQRVDELEAAICYLRARQAAQPKTEVERRAVLAVLIQAFEDRLSLTRAGIEGKSGVKGR